MRDRPECFPQNADIWSEVKTDQCVRTDGPCMGMRTWLVKQGQRLDFPARPVVKNSPHNAGDLGSIPGQRTRIPEQLDLCTTDQRDVCTATSGPSHHN